jgi:hypothetical protein
VTEINAGKEANWTKNFAWEKRFKQIIEGVSVASLHFGRNQ